MPHNTFIFIVKDADTFNAMQPNPTVADSSTKPFTDFLEAGPIDIVTARIPDDFNVTENPDSSDMHTYLRREETSITNEVTTDTAAQLALQTLMCGFPHI